MVEGEKGRRGRGRGTKGKQIQRELPMLVLAGMARGGVTGLGRNSKNLQRGRGMSDLLEVDTDTGRRVEHSVFDMAQHAV